MTSTSSSGETSHSPESCGSTGVTTPEGFTAETTSIAQRHARWRPSFHLMPKTGWINDPCAPGYDPSTGLYHISFQWNPNGPDWGDIVWGTATSYDMISWKVEEKPILSPDQSYDSKGVFTGCFLKAQDGSSSLNYIYTSVSSLPIHHTIPHQTGCETLSIATSFDQGKTWHKSQKNPILSCEPPGLDVTGWRDPFCAPWPNMSKILDFDQETLFGIISGGIRDITPTSFLYRIDPKNPSDWDYIGPLADFGLNFRPSRWSGDLGKNWEVTNFLSLPAQSNPNSDSFSTYDFLIMGTEGCLDGSSSSAEAGPSRPNRCQLWMSGEVHKDEATCSPNMSYEFGGHLDHGCMYAANSFFDPRSLKHIVWGWITEEDLCDDLRHQQGWSGVLSMPRQLTLQTLNHVVGALVSDLPSITSIRVKPEISGGAYTIQTLASEPFEPLVQHLRKSSDTHFSCLGKAYLSNNSNTIDIGFPPESLRSKNWELECSFKISKACSQVGVSVIHSRGGEFQSHIPENPLTDMADFEKSTKMTFQPRKELFTISRPSFPRHDSSLLVNSSPETAPHSLFVGRNPGGEEWSETLDIRAWRDNSVLEVFVNGRTAISTRIYAAEETFGMQFFAEDDGSDEMLRTSYTGPTELRYANLWEGISTSAI